MWIIAQRTLRFFWEQHADAQGPLEAWYHHVEREHWTTPADVQKAYRSASILPDNRVVFNIKGNDYRLVAKIHYNTQMIYIRYIDTHAEYDRIDANTI